MVAMGDRMTQRIGLVCAGALVMGMGAMVGDHTPVTAAGASVLQVAELADQALAPFYNRLMASPMDQITDDRGVRMGSLGSDLFHDPADSYNEFWAVTDRGPNGNPSIRTFVVPAFSPVIMHLRVHGSTVSVLQSIPIVDASERPVTGLSNVPTFDELPYNYNGTSTLNYNANGLDTEGLVRMRDGSFWLVDEYSPSLVHVAPNGVVMDRFVPVDSQLGSTLATTPNYRVKKYLPAILNARRQNRGFEGLAISADEKTLFLAMQSPLEYPTRALGRASRLARILKFDIGSERVTGEYVYEFDEVCSFLSLATGCGTAPGEMKISALIWVNATTLLVEERTDAVAKVYRVDLTRATDIFGSQWDTRASAPTATTTALESLTAPAASGITVLPKTLVVDLSTLPNMPGKIEGMALATSSVLVVANDNDFGLVDNATFTAAGRLSNDTMARSQVIYIQLPTPVN